MPENCPYHGHALRYAPGKGMVGCRACAKDCSWKCMGAGCYGPAHYLQPTPTIQDFKVVKMQ